MRRVLIAFYYIPNQAFSMTYCSVSKRFMDKDAKNFLILRLLQTEIENNNLDMHLENSHSLTWTEKGKGGSTQHFLLSLCISFPSCNPEKSKLSDSCNTRIETVAIRKAPLTFYSEFCRRL